MPETQHKHTSQSSVARSFDEGMHAGQDFGLYAAPFVVMAFVVLGGWITYRLARWFLRVTH